MVTDLELNDIKPLPYKQFEGRYIDAMPELRKEGRTPMTLRQIAEKRLEVIGSENESGWWDNYFDSSDGVAYFNGEIKIISNCELLIDVDSDVQLKNGALILTEEQYKNLDGKTFQRTELEDITGKYLTKKQAKENPIWKELLGDTLKPYADAVFKKGKKEHDFKKGMEVYLASEQEVPTLRSWYVYTLYNRSLLVGGNGLGGDSRLVGVLDNVDGQKEK